MYKDIFFTSKPLKLLTAQMINSKSLKDVILHCISTSLDFNF